VEEPLNHDERQRLMFLLQQAAAAVAEERGVDPARVSRVDLGDQGDDQKN
jgi:hypothetical protein